jgi:crotonobetainyl-CoA:carnitine CoA-transferase CaiB-like acyl-CoA transferase
MAHILAGVRVIDFGRYIAGPFCAALLADLGADVIRVDKIGGSEDRHLVTKHPGTDGMLYLPNNRNKRSMTLNPTSAFGPEIVKKLAQSADVVVANLPPSVLKGLGLDYESLRSLKPDIILTTANAFGLEGPDADKTGFDGIGQSMSGAVSISGFPDKPVKSQVSYVDYGTALAGAFGTLAALIHRMNTGNGQHVHGSLMGTALMMMNPIILEENIVGRTRKLTGNRSPIAGPSDVFGTKDGWVIVQVIGDPIYRRWAKLIGSEELLQEERFLDDNARGKHGQLLSDRMGEWCSQLTTAEALAQLEKARIPAGPVLSPLQALDQSHFWAAGFFKRLEHPSFDEEVTIVDTPVKFSSHADTIRTRPPIVGEHTVEILTELGYSALEIQQIRGAGTI